MQKDILNPILSMAPFGYAYRKLVLDAEGNPIDCIFLEVNSAFEEMTGLKAGNIIGKKFTEAIPGIKEDSFDWVNFYGNLTLSRSAKETVQYSESLGRWYRVTAFSPEPYHFVTFLQDITPEMKRIKLLERQQEQIRELMQDYEVILNNTHEAIFLVGTDGGKFRYQRINPAFKNMTGFDESDIIGKTPPEVPGWEETGRLIEENYARCCRSGTGISYEVRAPVPLGEKIWHTVLTPVYNRDQVRYLVGSARDITSEKIARQKLDKQAQYERTVSAIARHGLKERDIGIFMSESLRLLGKCAGASRVYIFERDAGSRTISNTYEWVAPGIEPQKENLQNLSEDDFAWWTEKLVAGELINYRYIEEIPDAHTRETLRAQDIKSILVIPIFAKGSYWGFLGFDECEKYREWSDDDVLMLSLAADIISGYVERHIQEEKLRQENQRFLALVNSTEDIIFELDSKQRYRSLYGRWLEKQGLKPEEFLGKTAREFFGDEGAAVHEAASLKALSGEFVVHEWTGETAEGIRHYQTSLSPIRGKHGEVTGVVGIGRDITSLVNLRRALQAEKELMRVTLESIGDAVVTTDLKGNITSVNRAALKISGWDYEEVIGRSFTEVFKLVNETTGEEVEDPVSKVLRTGRIVGLANHTALITKEGRKISIADSAAPIKDEQGNLFGVVMVFRDVTRERKHQERITYLSFLDPLTGLFNRRFMENKLKEIDETGHAPYTVLMGDVNGLKFVNDVFGHTEGDRLLKEAARVIKGSCSDNCIAARWGGDEFVVLLPCTEPKLAEKISHKIRNRSKKIADLSVRLSMALGWAAKTEKDQSVREVLKEAEENMYRNKLVEGRSYRRAIIDSLIATLNARSIETEEHAERLKKLCALIAERLGLPSRDRDELALLALLHDIGKIGISESILNKPGPLTEEEWKEVKKHPEIGYRIAHNTPELAKVAEFILHHHERWDGKGYPYGLKSEEIPHLCRILAVADAFDAMTGPRPYRRPVSVEEALVEIERNRGTQFDPDIARLFMEIMKS